MQVEAIVDTGATVTCVAKTYVSDRAIRPDNPILVEVGNGAKLFTLGTTDMVLKFGDKVIEHTAYVLDTTAFEAVLGMDFLSSPRCTGIITYPAPPKLLIDGATFVLRDMPSSRLNSAQKICRVFKTESYTLVEDVKSRALRELCVSRRQIAIDLFANYSNHQESIFCTRQNSAYFYDWSKVSKHGEVLWANPLSVSWIKC